MKLHDKTKDKIKQLFEMGDNFCETQIEKYAAYPDVMFVVGAFDTAFRDFSFKLRMKKEYSVEIYHNEIFDLDNVLSSWQEHLAHHLPDNSHNSNDLYSVLFSILQGAESIIDDDHFYWEEDEEEIEDEEIIETIKPSIHDEEDIGNHDDDYLEKTF